MEYLTLLALTIYLVNQNPRNKRK